MYVAGDRNVLLISVCDLQCYRKRNKQTKSKRSGPRFDPCGTPNNISNRELQLSPTIII